MSRAHGFVLLVGALVALPLVVSPPALAEQQDHPPATAKPGSNEVNSVAYPKAPGNMPASSDKGKPVEPVSDPSAKPEAPAKAGMQTAPETTATPTTAYPGAPGVMPAASDKGKPVEPKN